MRLACACLAFLAAVVVAPSAGAADVTLKKGDIVLVPGTNLLCLFDSDDKTGKLEVGCILTGSKGPLPKSVIPTYIGHAPRTLDSDTGVRR